MMEVEEGIGDSDTDAEWEDVGGKLVVLLVMFVILLWCHYCD